MTRTDQPAPAVTCMSCGAEYGQDHTADCEFER